MKKWNPPKSITILGTTFRIVLAELGGDGKKEYGETVGDDRLIRLNPAQSPEQMYATCLHEICHAIFHCSGMTHLLDEKTEEAVCVAIEHGLAPLVTLKGARK